MFVETNEWTFYSLHPLCTPLVMYVCTELTSFRFFLRFLYTYICSVNTYIHSWALVFCMYVCMYVRMYPCTTLESTLQYYLLYEAQSTKSEVCRTKERNITYLSNHHMAIKCILAQWLRRLRHTALDLGHHGRPKRDIGHEMPVHNVHMDPVGPPCFEYVFYRCAQVGEVG